jgi:hypothetical protein
VRAADGTFVKQRRLDFCNQSGSDAFTAMKIALLAAIKVLLQ